MSTLSAFLSPRKGALLSLLAAILPLISLPASAQSYPSKPVTFVVPTPAGGGHDAMARIIGERLSARWGQPILVDNRAGAGGMIGAEFVTRSAPDGYTFLFGSSAETVIAPLAYKAMRYDPARDLTPVTQAGVTPLVIVANPDAHIKSMPELIATVKANPGKISFGSLGNATSTHLAGELLNNMVKLDLQHIPYKGAAPATNDVVGGQVPIAIVGMAPVISHLKAGKLIALAVTQKNRAPFAPDIPAVSETPGLQGYEVTHWMGIFAPAKTPVDIIGKVQSDIAAVLAMPEVKARLYAIGIEPVGSTPADFQAFLGADRARFAHMFKVSGLMPE